MKKCNKSGCNNLVEDNCKYCEFHKQEFVENVGKVGIEIGAGVAFLYKHRDTVVKCGEAVGKFVVKNRKNIGDFAMKNGSKIVKLVIKKL